MDIPQRLLHAYFIWLTCITLCLSLYPSASQALTFALPPEGEDVVGEIQWITVQPGDTLHEIARIYDVGYQELLDANPGVNSQRLMTGQQLIVPTAFVLPKAPRMGLVVNLPEMRLYYYPVADNVVITYPIGIGREGWETPTTQTYVYSKEEYPSWNIPDSIRYHILQTKGKLLPKVIPPGPDNPLGDFAIRLALPGYLIHSTNNPYSIGKRASSGCIRLFPEDAEELFRNLPTGTPVYIIHTPYKLGWFHNELYLEAHSPLPKYYWGYIDQEIKASVQQQLTHIRWDAATKAIEEQIGLPIYIGDRY